MLTDKCVSLKHSKATINTKEIFSSFDFNADWINDQKFWNDYFENKYEDLKVNGSRLPLKVFILPHSHTDPGWVKTFINYYETETKLILDVVVEKLTEHQDMRFIWTEISFLDLWWKHATAVQQKALTTLVKSGRLEIMTGGWVMTDEANVHLYAMLDQLIEGHQWVKSKFDVAPKVGWSIDPFGQGSTVPHLLAKSGFDGAIIQRIHYNWKEWLARHQYEEFYWKSLWDDKDYTLLTHNMPFDLYSTGKSCGPDEERCNQMNFYRYVDKIPLGNFQKVTDKNIQSYAEMAIEQYAKTASLFPHNEALVLVGDDFTFKSEEEFMQQYKNYKKLIDFVNKNSISMFNGSTMQFGTPSEYFHEIKKRQKGDFPTLTGDFFPYADIFSSGKPAYWTGYYTTRPFYKLLSRNLEHNLRSAEILYSIAYNKARQSKSSFNDSKRMEKGYQLIIEARRNLGLFQHHDSITGTSKDLVMRDHLTRLQTSINNSINIQQQMIEFLLQRSHEKERNFIFYEFETDLDTKMPEKKIIHLLKENKEQKIILLNSLASKRVDVISIYVSEVKVRVIDENGRSLPFQINPVIQYGRIVDIKELLIRVDLPAFSLTVLKVVLDKNGDKDKIAEIITDFEEEEPLIENSKMRLIFNDTSGFLRHIYVKSLDKMLKTEIVFGAYNSAYTQSGAYLFKPESEDKTFFEDFSQIRIVVTKGKIASDITVVHSDLLTQTIRIYNTGTYLDETISIKNEIDFGSEDKNRDKEIFMKIKTSIGNSKNGEPEFFTDQNGFQWQPRRKVSKLGVEGNYYPITTSMFIQDDFKRLTLMTTHAQGATSFQKGELEVMLDRRTTNDDYRGLGEGILDSVKMQHKFILILELFDAVDATENYQVPSLLVHHLINSLNHPINIFHVDSKIDAKLHNQIELFNYKFPCDINLINLRSITHIDLEWLPSDSSLLILHRMGHECQLSNENFQELICSRNNNIKDNQITKLAKISQIQEASLTGLKINKNVKSLYKNIMKPMEIKTYYVTFN